MLSAPKKIKDFPFKGIAEKKGLRIKLSGPDPETLGRGLFSRYIVLDFILIS